MKIIGIFGLCFFISILIFLGWYYLIYKPLYYPGFSKTLTFNDSGLNKKILIATQDSKFKNQIVRDLINKILTREIYIKVTDVSRLDKINADNWKAIIILNTCEQWRMHKAVTNLLKRYNDYEKIILITTSGHGTWKTKKFNIDTITSASKINEVERVRNKIEIRLKKIIEK